MADPPQPAPRVDDAHATFVAGLFEQLRRPLLRYLTDLLGRREDAEDTAQETYVRLLAATNLERGDQQARAFAFKVATNLAYDRFRQRRVHAVLDETALAAAVSSEPLPDGIVAIEQAVAIVKRTLLELPERCRRVFLMRTAEELGYDEIAARLGVSRRTVEREMQQALHVCQERLAKRTKR
jgi:RNA polymerase sigma-70 factor (ECF subfamily)